MLARCLLGTLIAQHAGNLINAFGIGQLPKLTDRATCCIGLFRDLKLLVATCCDLWKVRDTEHLTLAAELS